MTMGHSELAFPEGERNFATTRWSVVLTAGRDQSPRAREALGRLCQIYWYPLYAYARRRGMSGPDAQDITQGFFAELIAKNGLAGVERVTRFRAYLLTGFKYFISNQTDRARAKKRGGGVAALSLHASDAEQRFAVEPSSNATPEKLFERRWALALLEQTLLRVEEEYADAGKRALFEALKPGLAGESPALAEIAASLKVTEGAIKVAAHRLRQRYREVLRAEIADTITHPDEVEDELQQLMSALSN